MLKNKGTHKKGFPLAKKRIIQTNKQNDYRNH